MSHDPHDYDTVEKVPGSPNASHDRQVADGVAWRAWKDAGPPEGDAEKSRYYASIVGNYFASSNDNANLALAFAILASLGVPHPGILPSSSIPRALRR